MSEICVKYTLLLCFSWPTKDSRSYVVGHVSLVAHGASRINCEHVIAG